MGITGIAQGLGRIGADIGGGAEILRQQRQEQAQQKLAQIQSQMQWMELQSKLKQAGITQTMQTPEGVQNFIQKLLGRKGTPEELLRASGMQSLTPRGRYTNLRYDKNGHLWGESTETGQLELLPTEGQFQPPEKAYMTAAKGLVKGDPVPDSKSVTGYSRPMYDGQGNLVKTIPNIVIPGMSAHVAQGWEKTSDEDGNEYLVPKTSVTTPVIPGAAAPRSSVGVPAAAKAPNVGGVTAPPAGTDMPPGARRIGHKPDTIIQRDAVKAASDARQAYTLMKDVEDNIGAAKKGNARASLALVFSAVRMMVQGAGRMTQVEVMQEARAGSYGQQIQRWFDMATRGTMPEDQMEQIREIVHNGYEAKRKGGAEAWQYAYPDRPMPVWLAGSGDNAKTAPAGSAPGAPAVGTVKQYQGSSYRFKGGDWKDKSNWVKQ